MRLISAYGSALIEGDADTTIGAELQSAGSDIEIGERSEDASEGTDEESSGSG